MIGFAHRGAPPAGVRENTLAAFRHALTNGAQALESDVWLTADGVPVLLHDAYYRAGFRRHTIAMLSASALPEWLPSLADLYRSTDIPFDLALDIKDQSAGAAVADVARAHGADARLWMVGTAGQVKAWQKLPGQARTVVSTSLRSRGQDRAERIEEAADAGASALNLKAPGWSAKYVERCHERDMLAFAWKVQTRAALATVQGFGCDGVFSDHLTVLAAATSGHA